MSRIRAVLKWARAHQALVTALVTVGLTLAVRYVPWIPSEEVLMILGIVLGAS